MRIEIAEKALADRSYLELYPFGYLRVVEFHA
ncbi:hypothetical protein LNAOJCKE_1567 [Methylorubrum aminovorans]|uniref:Uncharacterized protein n=1 Tax=Methylorubrum aminovorans TaxID=269069 RepID=A0ABQ4UAM9_9HYPH|nr:hypothetical protein LNAOJCKE_1567 [Methylorubrum aminovorans]